MLKILLVILITFISFFSNHTSVNAFTSYYDEFNTINQDLWSYFPRDGSIMIENGVMSLEPPELGYSPYIYGKIDTILEEGTGIEFRFKTDNISFHGVGISIGFTGSSDYPYYEFSLWFDTVFPGVKFEYNDYSISKFHCEPFLTGDDVRKRKTTSVDLNYNEWNIYRITKDNGIISVYVNNLDVGDSIVSYSGNDCLPKNIILGNPLNFNGISWSSISIDYVKNYLLDDYPIPQEKNIKYILIPGLGASWNTLAMVYDEEVENSDWSMTPFVTNYENISSYFDSKNLDYDVWNYDWRRPLLEIVSDFEEYIDENIEENDEVYVVGHSLGGLVARMWYQKNSNDDRIGKVISVGSPHKGAVKAYEAYNGGKLIEGYDFGFTVWNLYLTLINKGGSTMIDTIREEAPILRDISPTYDFLNINNLPLPKEESKYFNSILSDWNENYNNWDKVWPITGIGEETKYKINLKNRSIFDQVLNLWPDGKPDSYENGDGDGTVLTESAGFGKENRVEVVGGHGDLISTFLNKILRILEVEDSDLSDSDGIYDGRIFYLGSPAEMKVKCEGIEEKVGENGFVFVSRAENDSNCQVKITGTGEGVYHLVMADTTLNNWQYFENMIESDEELILDVDNRANIINTEESEDYLFGLILNDIKLLEETGVRDDYKNVKKAVVKKDIEYIIDWSLRFRKKHKEELLTKRIVVNCLKIGPSHKVYAKMIWQKNYLKVSENFLKTAEKLSVLKRLRSRGVSSFEANNYFWMENIVDRIKNSSNDGERFLLYRVLVKVFTMF